MKDYFIVIGATNIDVCGKSDYPLIKGDSTLGKVNTTIGGVGHNIAVNLTNLGLNTIFITSIGNDGFSRLAKADLKSYENMGIIVNHVNHGSGIYLYIENSKGEMIHAINDMSINDYLIPAVLAKHKTLIKEARYVIIDTNIPIDSIEYITTLNKNIIADAVSCEKSKKLLPFLDKIKILKPNILELETLAKRNIKNDDDVIEAAKTLIDKGCEIIVTSLGKKGSVYIDKKEIVFLENPKTKKIANTTGAGDSYTAGLCYGLINGYDSLEILKIATSCAIITMETEEPISNNLNAERMKEIKNESIFGYSSRSFDSN